jgi:glycosyltransferase involved in cell wall biosynthesis
MLDDRKVVLFVTPAPSFLVSHRLSVLRECFARGLEPHLVVPQSDDLLPDELEGIPTHRIHFPRSTMSIRDLARTASELEEVFVAVQPCICHAIAIQAGFVSAMAALISPPEHLVISFTGLGHLWTPPTSARRRLLQLLVGSTIALGSYRAKSTWIFQNDDDVQEFARSKGVRGLAQIRLVPGSGVDLSRFEKNAATERRIVLFLGRCIDEKGIREFLEVAKRTRTSPHLKRFDFVVAGRPDSGNPTSIDEAELDRAVSDGVIARWGFVSDVPALLAETALLVFPSRREGFPKAIMEASAAGVPTIGFDVPGVRSAITPGENGWLVPLGDVDSLYNLATSLLTVPERLERLGERARRVAVDRFEATALAAHTVDAYGVKAEEG